MKEFKPIPTKLEEYLYHSAASIIRDARANFWEELPNRGEAHYIEHYIRRFDDLLPVLSENISEISFRLLNIRNRRHTEVMFFIPCQGRLTPLRLISTRYRLRGELGVEKGERLFIYYREPYSTTGERLLGALREDLDLIHQYLEDGKAIVDTLATDTRVQLSQEINLLREELGGIPQLAEELVDLGFKRRLEELS